MQMLFATKGTVSHIQLLRDCDRRSIGMCFVTYRYKTDAVRALRAFRRNGLPGRRWHLTIVAPRRVELNRKTAPSVAAAPSPDDREMTDSIDTSFETSFVMRFSRMSIANNDIADESMDDNEVEMALSRLALSQD
jgi:hypothetical protein